MSLHQYQLFHVKKVDLTLIAADYIELVVGIHRSLAPALGRLQVPLSIVYVR